MHHICYQLVIAFLFSFNLLEANNMSSSRDVQFSMIEEKNMQEFEKEIAYFFGVNCPEPVIEAYMTALKKLEQMGTKSPIHLLEQEIVPYLEVAYKEIAQQRNWNFNTYQAAMLELQIILGNANRSSFETIQNLMSELYTLIFQSSSPNIRKAAMLRTFLYQYKIDALKREQKISQEEMKAMILLAKTSEKLLNSLK